MTIPTTISLARSARRADRRNRRTAAVLAQMRRGACLCLSYAPRPHWRLSTGEFVTEEVARTLINTPSVVGVGDTLFNDGACQTYRFTPKPKRR